MKLLYKTNKTAKEVWYNICRNQILSEDFIRRHIDKVDWCQISFHQQMSIEFAEEFKDKLWWDAVARNPNISEEFISYFFSREDILERYIKGNSPETDKTKMPTNHVFSQMWFDIIHHHNLSESFLREFKDDVDWKAISLQYKLSFDFIREFQDKLQSDSLSKNRTFKNMEQLEELGNRLNWEHISRYQNINEQFIRKWSDKLDFKNLFYSPNPCRETQIKVSDQFLKEVTDIFADVDSKLIISILTSSYKMKMKQLKEFIKNYERKINWSEVSRQKLTMKFIDKYADKLDWSALSFWQKLTPYIVKKYRKRINWGELSMNASIDDKIIIDNIDRFESASISFMLGYRTFKEETLDKYPIQGDGWKKVCELPNLSEKFLRDHIKNLHWKTVVQYQQLSEEFIREFQNKLDWFEISGWQNLSEDFIWEFRKKLDLVHAVGKNKLSEPFIEKIVNEYE